MTVNVINVSNIQNDLKVEGATGQVINGILAEINTYYKIGIFHVISNWDSNYFYKWLQGFLINVDITHFVKTLLSKFNTICDKNLDHQILKDL